MTVSDAAIVLEVASTLEESGEVGLTDTAKLLRGMLGEIQRLGTQLTAAQSERAESAEAKLASQVPGVVRIPEYPNVMVRQSMEHTARHAGILEGVAWARTHAEVVVETVVLPDAPDRKTMDPDFDVDGTGMSDCDLVIRGYNLAVSRLRAMQQAREVV